MGTCRFPARSGSGEPPCDISVLRVKRPDPEGTSAQTLGTANANETPGSIVPFHEPRRAQTPRDAVAAVVVLTVQPSLFPRRVFVALVFLVALSRCLSLGLSRPLQSLYRFTLVRAYTLTPLAVTSRYRAFEAFANEFFRSII